jgi:branched-subunit amino acid ABC-type transport system permease component
MSSILNQILHGLMLGVLYSLIASGYTLIFGVLNVVNFAHGDVCILGAFVLMTGVLILAPLSITLGSWYFIPFLILLAIAVTGGLGVVIERLTVKPFRKVGHMPLFLGSVAVAFIIREVIKHLYPDGANPKQFPIILTNLKFQWLGMDIRLSNLIIIAIAAALFISLFTFVNKTKIGLQIKASSEDIDAAQMMGVSLNKTYAAIYFIASCVGALAGILNGIYFQIMQYNMGVITGIIGFSAAIFGGLGNVYGAIIGGLILGFVESFTVAFVPGGTPYKEVFAFMIVIIFLALKPAGILGKKTIEKV